MQAFSLLLRYDTVNEYVAMLTMSDEDTIKVGIEMSKYSSAISAISFNSASNESCAIYSLSSGAMLSIYCLSISIIGV